MLADLNLVYVITDEFFSVRLQVCTLSFTTSLSITSALSHGPTYSSVLPLSLLVLVMCSCSTSIVRV